MKVDFHELAAQLGSRDVEERRSAAAALARHSANAQTAAVELVQAAGDADEGVREWAVAALEDIGPPREADFSALADLLMDPNLDTAYWSATLLGRAGPAAAPAVGALERALRARQETAIRERVAWALGKIGPPASAASAAIEAAASDPQCSPRLARLCRQALQSIGESGR